MKKLSNTSCTHSRFKRRCRISRSPSNSLIHHPTPRVPLLFQSRLLRTHLPPINNAPRINLELLLPPRRKLLAHAIRRIKCRLIHALPQIALATIPFTQVGSRVVQTDHHGVVCVAGRGEMDLCGSVSSHRGGRRERYTHTNHIAHITRLARTHHKAIPAFVPDLVRCDSAQRARNHVDQRFPNGLAAPYGLDLPDARRAVDCQAGPLLEAASREFGIGDVVADAPGGGRRTVLVEEG
jgi:hypothetical protein